MNDRQRVKAVLNYESYDRLPLVHFGFWQQTLQKWVDEGHLTPEEAGGWSDSSPIDKQISGKLGFDLNWGGCFYPDFFISPLFEAKTLKVHPDGSREYLQGDGVIVLQKDDVVSIPMEVDHLLKDRCSWEEHYRPRLQFFEKRITCAQVNTGLEILPFESGGLECLRREDRESSVGLFCGSLLGTIRNILGIEGLSYLFVDDEALCDEIIETVANLCYRCVEYTLSLGARFDYAYFWEDICFKNGPLVSPNLFSRKVGPHYRKFTQLLNRYGIEIISVDCDGLIDALIPVWLENGVNTMFPIEVGTWNGNIASWRQQYGQILRGVGGMNKVVFSRDCQAIDAEIERLRPMIESGGYLPCPDHRIPPDAKWDNVRYYCDRMHEIF